MSPEIIDLSYMPSMPNAPEVETDILACLFAQKDKPEITTQILRELTADDFYSTLNQEVFKACHELFQQSKPLDEGFVNDRLRQNLSHIPISGEFVAGLRWQYSGINLPEAITLLKAKSNNRKLITGFYTLLSEKGATDDPMLLERVQGILLSLSQHQTKSTEATISQVLPSVVSELEERMERKQTLRGISTGFTRLDSLIGGLQKTRLITLCARTGIGKTSYALMIASHVARQEKQIVLYFTMEMSKEELAERLVCQVEGIDSSLLRNGNLDQIIYSRFLNAMAKMDAVPLVLDDAPQTLTSIRAKVMRVQAQHGSVGFVVVDYLGLVRGESNGNSNRYEQVSGVVRGLKDIALEFKIPVLCLAQPNREVDRRGDNKLRLSDLKDSGECEQASDIVMFLNGKNESERELAIEKQRNGPKSSIRYQFKPETTAFKECWL